MDEYHPILSEEPPALRGKKYKRRFRLWQKQPHCHYCGVRLVFNEATIDHVIPRSKGGSNAVKNLVIACVLCNRRKGNMMPTTATIHP